MDGRELRLALALAYAGHSAKLGAQIRPYPSAEAAWEARDRWLPDESALRRQHLESPPTKQLAWLATKDSDAWHLLALGDDGYPELLAALPDAPGVLFVRGDRQILQHPQLAMVGARGGSAEGRNNAFRLAKALAARGFVITSGLAAGIDAASHEGALESGRSIAVMGTGPDSIYPARHAALAEKMVAGGGALVTEFPPGEKPEPFHFPMRNRIISGLSLGVIVVEAALKSGSLITAKLSLEQGREVFALPGSLHNPLSRGCHQLLRDGANWLETVDDVLDVFGSLQTLAQGAENPQPEVRTCRPALLDSFLAGTNTLDQLQRRSGLLLAELLEQLADMELEGWVEKTPGGYQRTA